jgi:hypothetical protein
MLLWATYKGEGIGWTAIINGFYGPLVIAYCHHVLPHNPWLVLLGMPLIGIAYSMQGKAGLGDTGSCLFTTTLMKQTGWGVLTCRLILDTTLMIIGFIGARKYVTFGTILLTITTGPGLHFAYKVLKYKPTKIEHKYLIQLKTVHTSEIINRGFIKEPHFNDLLFFVIIFSIVTPLVDLWKLLADILLR